MNKIDPHNRGLHSLISALKQVDTRCSAAFKQYGVRSLWYMCHHDNLAGILTHGILSHSSIDDLPHEDISHAEVQRYRAKPEPVYNRKIHEYAPSYLNAKNPMLYLRREVQSNLCLIEIDISIVDKVEFIFTDGNAASKDTCFYHDLEQLKLLPWEVLHNDSWSHFIDGKRKRCAEVLFYPRIESEYFKALHCYSTITVNELMHLDSRIQHSPELFFRL